MEENQAEGMLDDVTGEVKNAYGGLTGDTTTQVKGKAQQASGQAQQYYGEAIEATREFVADQPVTGLLAAAGLGLVLGYILGRR